MYFFVAEKPHDAIVKFNMYQNLDHVVFLYFVDAAHSEDSDNESATLPIFSVLMLLVVQQE